MGTCVYKDTGHMVSDLHELRAYLPPNHLGIRQVLASFIYDVRHSDVR